MIRPPKTVVDVQHNGLVIRLELKFDEVTRIHVIPRFDSKTIGEWVRIARKGKTIGYITKVALKEQGFHLEKQNRRLTPFEQKRMLKEGRCQEHG